MYSTEGEILRHQLAIEHTFSQYNCCILRSDPCCKPKHEPPKESLNCCLIRQGHGGGFHTNQFSRRW